VAYRSCKSCQEWLYNEETGKIKQRLGKDVKRGDALPPCESCPKKSPKEAKFYELSAKNYKAVQVYHQVQATNGRCLSERESRDRVLCRNLAMIHQILSGHEKAALSSTLLTAITLKGLG